MGIAVCDAVSKVDKVRGIGQNARLGVRRALRRDCGSSSRQRLAPVHISQAVIAFEDRPI